MSKDDTMFTVREEDGARILCAQGDWTVMTVHKVDRDTELGALDGVDVTAIGDIDTAGALVLSRLAGPALEHLSGTHESARQLISLMTQTDIACDPPSLPGGSLMDLLERTGRSSIRLWNESVETLAFLGEALSTCTRLIFQPRRLRWTPMVAVMEEAGLDALPIVAFLSFFVGMVVAFIGATSLSEFGATIFTVELVGISMMREFGVILTAIILSGRTNSAFTAQIGAMRMRQEVDAMTTLGLSPMEVLVAPRIFAMVVMTPFLSFISTLSGMAGGMLVGWLALDISPVVFTARIQDYVPVSNFWVGLSKAPIFGLIVALIGCRQGLLVGGSVQSLGKHTTTSVVQAIFSIIVIDAVFAIFYMELGL
ncbi:MAG: ABC transporter permease [Hyphomonadaceae bacterium]|nr:ABC transporter permease [Hyphomonadaceae bacterium]